MQYQESPYAPQQAVAPPPQSQDYRRRANSNYFELDADRRRNKSDRSERFSHRLTGLDVMPPSSSGKGDKFRDQIDDDEAAIDFCCEFLRAKFGFQEGSVSNQREHVLLLLANGKARRPSPWTSTSSRCTRSSCRITTSGAAS